MRKFPYLIIAIGLLVFLYPQGYGWYQGYKEASMLEEWEMSTLEGNNHQVEEKLQHEYEELNQLFLQEVDSEEESQVETSETETPVEEKKAETNSAPIATIQIKKIDLSLPIVSGTSHENLKYAAGHMQQTTELGEVGNAAVAAHRARTHGRLFNRLNEVGIGDEIIIETGDKEVVYTVFNVLRVKPEDVSVLNKNNRDRVLTLITCDPVTDPTHRIIVHAVVR